MSQTLLRAWMRCSQRPHRCVDLVGGQFTRYNGELFALASMEDAELAVVALARRVEALEASLVVDIPNADSRIDESNLQPALRATVTRLKQLRECLVKAEKETEANLIEMKNLQVENGKLRYQIAHMRRSMDAEPTS